MNKNEKEIAILYWTDLPLGLKDWEKSFSIFQRESIRWIEYLEGGASSL